VITKVKVIACVSITFHFIYLVFFLSVSIGMVFAGPVKQDTMSAELAEQQIVVIPCPK
jgi:hypothetical protein